MTYTVTKISHEVLDLQFPSHELRIQPRIAQSDTLSTEDRLGPKQLALPFCESLLLDSNPSLLLRVSHPYEALIMRWLDSG
jgi:hypothetical protein